jgi:hypothetical protein
MTNEHCSVFLNDPHSPISFGTDSDADDDFESVIEDFMNLPDLEIPQVHSPMSIFNVPQFIVDILIFF